MRIVITRKKVKNGLVTGRISVDGQEIGETFENDSLKIRAGRYSGVLRYFSGKNFVQGPLGTIGKTGDFLVEVSGVAGRSDILLHGGNKAIQSEGCIMLGPVAKDPKTNIPHLDYTHPLRKLRQLFYGSELPNQTPNKAIVIEVNDISSCLE